MAIQIRSTRYGSATAQKLIAELMADLEERYGSGDATPVAGIEFDPPDGGFLVAYLDGQPVGCGAWRSHGHSADVAEVKRVFVRAQVRRQGLAKQIMAALEDDARTVAASGSSWRPAPASPRRWRSIKPSATSASPTSATTRTSPGRAASPRRSSRS